MEDQYGDINCNISQTLGKRFFTHTNFNSSQQIPCMFIMHIKNAFFFFFACSNEKKIIIKPFNANTRD